MTKYGGYDCWQVTPRASEDCLSAFALLHFFLPTETMKRYGPPLQHYRQEFSSSQRYYKKPRLPPTKPSRKSFFDFRLSRIIIGSYVAGKQNPQHISRIADLGGLRKFHALVHSIRRYCESILPQLRRAQLTKTSELRSRNNTEMKKKRKRPRQRTRIRRCASASIFGTTPTRNHVRIASLSLSKAARRGT